MQSVEALVGARPQEIYLQSGALISVGSCALIVLSYVRRRRWRRHPNPILFWKAAIDLVYALRFLFRWDEIVGPLGCRALAALSQFCLLASECWFVNMSLDLYRCSTNPFTNVQQSMRWYHAFAWGTGALAATTLWLSGLQFQTDDDPFCYVTERDTTLQYLYYAAVALSVACAVVLSILETRAYPHGGMKEALQAKKDVIRSARVFTLVYGVYQLVLISLWIADMVAFDTDQSSAVTRIRNGTFFLQAGKGLIDLVIWLVTNGDALRRRPTPTPLVATRTTSAIESSSSREVDQYSDVNIDLEPQLNVELRKEVLHFTTRGVVAASANARRVSATRSVVRLRLHELGMVVAFNDFQASVFREIRHGFGIDEMAYRRSFVATCHERIQSGGSSGAFMFYTADYMYLVKTVTKTERSVLLKMLPKYVAHMRENPRSHLTRYYGCHSIEMYGQVFSFVVMGNVIGRVSMHQFYDIKGSWINRNAQVRRWPMLWSFRRGETND
jgi:1-phosphatidylinositol-4-phosphate 5-kinase